MRKRSGKWLHPADPPSTALNRQTRSMAVPAEWTSAARPPFAAVRPAARSRWRAAPRPAFPSPACPPAGARSSRSAPAAPSEAAEAWHARRGARPAHDVCMFTSQLRPVSAAASSLSPAHAPAHLQLAVADRVGDVHDKVDRAQLCVRLCPRPVPPPHDVNTTAGCSARARANPQPCRTRLMAPCRRNVWSIFANRSASVGTPAASTSPPVPKPPVRNGHCGDERRGRRG